MTSSSLPNESGVHQLMQQALDERVFPGAVLLAAREGNIFFHKAWGVADLSSGRPVTVDTVYDLASLTKPLATTLAVMRLIQTGRLTLETPLAPVLPVMADTAKAGVTLRQLLSHCSGWPAWQPYFEQLRQHPEEDRRRRLAQMLAAEPLIAVPGTAALYSDLDYMTLGLVVEHISGERLDRFVRREIYQPLGIDDLFFNPLDASPLPRDYAATERCPWRGGVLSGAVHDDNAYVLNGVAGHAGLFGTARAVFTLLQALLSAYRGEADSDLLAPDLVRAFWRRSGDSGWTLGFDTPSVQGSSSGTFFSPNSVGHLGFTGTSFWMDLDRRITIIVLTNRVHPVRSNEKIRAFRPRIHDVLMEWFLLCSS
jgi:CubicO group peptidase (beta-lactamase class C family)